MLKIKEFLNNPLGKGATIPGRNIILTNLDYRLQILQKNKKIDLNIYTQDDMVYYHCKIPTESVDRNNYYDVIIKFKPTSEAHLIDKSYKQYDVEFFSNCPSFTYTYAYVAKLNGYLIPEFENKYEEITLKFPPVSRNPGLTFGYEKSIYFACKFLLEDKQRLLKSYVKTYGKPLTQNIFKEIKTTLLVEEEIKREKSKKKENKFIDKKTKKTAEKAIQNFNKQQSKSNVNTIKKTTPIKNKNNKIKPIKKKK